MSAILLSAHVIVAILAVGPIAVAASMFPRYARDGGPVANALYRICQTYAVVVWRFHCSVSPRRSRWVC